MARATSPGSSWPPAKTIALSSHRVIRERAARLARILPIVTGFSLPQASIIAVGGRRHGFRLLDSVNQDPVDEFVVEAHETLDPLGFMHRVGVVPDHVVVAFCLDSQMIVVGDALVGTAREIAAEAQQVQE